MKKETVFQGAASCLVILLLAGLLVACSGGSAYLPPVGTKLYHKGEKAPFSYVTAEDLTNMSLTKSDWAGMNKVKIHARRTEATGDSPKAYFSPEDLPKTPVVAANKTATAMPTAVVSISDQGPKTMGDLNFLEWLGKLVTDYWILLVVLALAVLTGLGVFHWEGVISGPKSLDIVLTNLFTKDGLPVTTVEFVVGVVLESVADQRSWFNSLKGRTTAEKMLEAEKQIRQCVETAITSVVTTTSIFDLGQALSAWCKTREGLEWPNVGLRLKSIHSSGFTTTPATEAMMRSVRAAEQHGTSALQYFEKVSQGKAQDYSPEQIAAAYTRLMMATNQNGGGTLLLRPEDYSAPQNEKGG